MKHALARFVFKDFTFTYYLPESAHENSELLESFSQYMLSLRGPISLTLVLKQEKTYVTYTALYNTHIITKRKSKSPNPSSLKLCEEVKTLDFPFGVLLSLFAGGIFFTNSKESVSRHADYLADFITKENISYSIWDKQIKANQFRPYFKTQKKPRYKNKLETFYKMAV